RTQEPWLEWAGKRESEALGFAVDPVALHIHERIAAQAMLRVAARQDIERTLFSDPEQEYNEAVAAERTGPLHYSRGRQDGPAGLLLALLLWLVHLLPPDADLFRLVGRFVELNDSFQSSRQLVHQDRMDPALSLFHTLVPLQQERLGLGVPLLALGPERQVG